MRCENNETLTRSEIYDQPQIGKERGATCPNDAVLACGVENPWNLCERCAALPIFKRLRKRRPIRNCVRATSLIWQAAGAPSSGGGLAGVCRTCGQAGTGQRFADWVKPTFTDADKLLAGDIVCDACLFCFTDQSTAVQAKLRKDKPQKFRNYSHFVVGGEWRVYSKGDKRGMLAALLAEPEAAVIAESGQKHLAFRCSPGWWQFEEQRLRPAWNAELFAAVERLYQAGCSKTEMETGHYSQKAIAACGLDSWAPGETQIKPQRGTLLFRLMLFLVQKVEEETQIGS